MQRFYLALFILSTFLLSSSIALATEGGHLPLGNFAFRVANLIAFLAVIVYFFGAKIKRFFIARTEGIAQELQSLEQRKEEAEKHLAEVEARIASLEAECHAILETYTTQGEAAKAAIIAEAEKTAAQIGQHARSAAQNEIEAAIESLREEVADKIIEATEKLLAKKLTGEEHMRLVDKYITKVVLN